MNYLAHWSRVVRVAATRCSSRLHVANRHPARIQVIRSPAGVEECLAEVSLAGEWDVKTPLDTPNRRCLATIAAKYRLRSSSVSPDQ